MLRNVFFFNKEVAELLINDSRYCRVVIDETMSLTMTLGWEVGNWCGCTLFKLYIGPHYKCMVSLQRSTTSLVLVRLYNDSTDLTAMYSVISHWEAEIMAKSIWRHHQGIMSEKEKKSLMNLTERTPSFSWAVTVGRKGLYQTVYKTQVTICYKSKSLKVLSYLYTLLRATATMEGKTGSVNG